MSTTHILSVDKEKSRTDPDSTKRIERIIEMSDGNKAYVGDGAGNGDIRATNDVDGTILNGGAGNDALRGGRYDDILSGGSGNDSYYGGDGADQFRFFGNQIDGAGDTDKVLDLDFSEGDSIVFGNYGAESFADTDGANAYNGGGDVQISSWEGLVAAVQQLGERATVSQKGTTDVLILSIMVGEQIQEIQITGGFAAFQNAMNPELDA